MLWQTCTIYSTNVTGPAPCTEARHHPVHVASYRGIRLLARLPSRILPPPQNKERKKLKVQNAPSQSFISATDVAVVVVNVGRRRRCFSFYISRSSTENGRHPYGNHNSNAAHEKLLFTESYIEKDYPDMNGVWICAACEFHSVWHIHRRVYSTQNLAKIVWNKSQHMARNIIWLCACCPPSFFVFVISCLVCV